MMKKLLLTVAIAGLAAYTQAQGLVNFNTRTVAAKAYNIDGVTPLTGTGFWAQLYAADGTVTDMKSLAAKGTAVNFQTGSGAGYVTTAKPAVPVSAAAGLVTLQVRAWEGTAASYEDAVKAGAKTGFSGMIQINSVAAPAPSPNLVGLKSFQLTPEPSTIALGVMGLSLLVFRRRK